MHGWFNSSERTDAMKSAKLMAVGFLIAALTATGCGDKKPDAPKVEEKKPDPADSHEHGAGPHGGVLFDFGKHHGEFTVDHDKKECAVYVLGGDEKTPRPVAADEFTLTTKETKTKDGKVVPPMTIKLLPADAKDGKAAKFAGTDPGLGNVAEFEGAVSGKIDGKPSKGEFKE